VFTTAGLFPLQSADGLSSRDKWLYGGQAGVDWGLGNQDIFQLAGSYYSYQNLQAVTNSASLMNASGVGCNTNSAEENQSAPQYMQFGNTLTSICNSADGRPGMVGLASGYNILNINTVYDSSFFAPTHIKLSADYAKNLNYNTSKFDSVIVNGEGGLPQTNQSNNGQTNAFQVRTDIGWPKFDSFGKWSVFTYYKYVERDAVLDAFSDSDFHLGGTNVQGWTIGGNYGLVKNVWLTGRWLSGNVISGAQYGVDVMQLDLNTRF
jgi:hypothetical protein